MKDLQSVDQLVSDAEELLSKLGSAASPEIRGLRDKVESSIGEMKDVISRRAKDGVDTAQDVAKSVIEFVQDNPAVAIAAGAAIAVGLIYMGLTQRRSERFG